MQDPEDVASDARMSRTAGPVPSRNGRLRVVINCDDLGMSPQINLAIFRLMDTGRVTSATVIANGPGAEDAARRLKEYSAVSFGVHLNATEFKPLTDHPGLRPLRGGNGEFVNLVRHVPLNSAVRDGVYAEWCAQVERALELGIPVSHLDSHHHTHTVPALFGVLKRIQRKFRVHRIRITRNLFSPQERIGARERLLKKTWNFALRHYGMATRTTDWFTSFRVFRQQLQAGSYPTGTLELSAHPGSPDYDEETNLLTEKWEEQFTPGARLVSYREI